MSLEDVTGAATAAPEPTAIVETPAAPVEAVSTPSTAPETSLRDTAGEVWDKLNSERDESGKFASKDKTPAAPEKGDAAATEVSDATKEQAASLNAPPMPNSWSKEKAETWSKLDPSAREYIAQREIEVQRGFAKQAEKFAPYQAMDQLFAPYADKMKASGMNPVQAVQRLLNAQRILDTNPVHGLAWLARSYGIDVNSIPQQVAQMQAQTAQVDPRVETALQRVERLEAELQERQEAERQSLNSSILSEIDTFRASGKHPFFEDVRVEMAELITIGSAANLNDAYERAVWANPTTRAKLIEAQRKTEAEQAQAAALKAKQAGSINVRSSPASTTPNRNPRETMAAAWDRAQAM
jgi:hypothetical protein